MDLHGGCMQKVSLMEIDNKTMSVGIYKVLDALYRDYHSTPKHLLKDKLPTAHYIRIYNEENDFIGMTSYQAITKTLALTERTILYPKYRGKGYGSAACRALEKLLKKKKFKKICSEVFTTNLPMLFLKMKQGHLIEGLMRDHDDTGIDQYYLGKVL